MVSVVGYIEFQGSKLGSEGQIACFLLCAESRLKYMQVGHECRKGTMWGREAPTREGGRTRAGNREGKDNTLHVSFYMCTLGLTCMYV